MTALTDNHADLFSYFNFIRQLFVTEIFSAFPRSLTNRKRLINKRRLILLLIS